MMLISNLERWNEWVSVNLISTKESLLFNYESFFFFLFSCSVVSVNVTLTTENISKIG